MFTSVIPNGLLVIILIWFCIVLQAEDKLAAMWERTHPAGPPSEILPDFLYLSGLKSASPLAMSQLPFREFTHVVWATSERTTPFKAEIYLPITVLDDLLVNLFNQSQPQGCTMEHSRWMCVNPDSGSYLGDAYKSNSVVRTWCVPYPYP